MPKVINTSWIKNDVDRFVLASLEREGLKPNRPAGKRPELASLAELFEPDRDRLHVDPRTAAQLLWGLSLAANHPALNYDTPLTAPELVSYLLDGIRSTTPS